MIQRLQALLRWLFMRAEAVFNRAFGDRLNPLYYLGAIVFLLFWIVAIVPSAGANTSYCASDSRR